MKPLIASFLWSVLGVSCVHPVICLASEPAAAKDPHGVKPPVSPKVFSGEGWAIVAPEDWRPLERPPRPVVHYVVGDAREGVPLFDGTLSVLKAGLQIQVFPAVGRTVKEHVDKDMKELRESGAFDLLQEPKLEEMKLVDGTPAAVMDLEFVRRQNGRVSFQTKVYCANAKGDHLVASTFVTCSRAGRLSVHAMSLAPFMRAHALSLSLDPSKLDASGVLPAYQKHTWNVGAAIDQTRRGNDLLEKKQYADATAAFRQAIQIWDNVPAAHNGLSWAILHDGKPTAEQLAEALREAQLAVKQTEELDYSALDTLALAYDRNGDRESARKAIRQALKLAPENAELKDRLKSLE